MTVFNTFCTIRSQRASAKCGSTPPSVSPSCNNIPHHPSSPRCAAHLTVTTVTQAYHTLNPRAAVDFYNEISLLYGTISEFCTPETCPTMSAGSEWQQYRHGSRLRVRCTAALASSHSALSYVDRTSPFPNTFAHSHRRQVRVPLGRWRTSDKADQGASMYVHSCASHAPALLGRLPPPTQGVGHEGGRAARQPGKQQRNPVSTIRRRCPVLIPVSP